MTKVSRSTYVYAALLGVCVGLWWPLDASAQVCEGTVPPADSTYGNQGAAYSACQARLGVMYRNSFGDWQGTAHTCTAGGSGASSYYVMVVTTSASRTYAPNAGCFGAGGATLNLTKHFYNGSSSCANQSSFPSGASGTYCNSGCSVVCNGSSCTPDGSVCSGDPVPGPDPEEPPPVCPPGDLFCDPPELDDPPDPNQPPADPNVPPTDDDPTDPPPPPPPPPESEDFEYDWSGWYGAIVGAVDRVRFAVNDTRADSALIVSAIANAQATIAASINTASANERAVITAQTTTLNSILTQIHAAVTANLTAAELDVSLDRLSGDLVTAIEGISSDPPPTFDDGNIVAAIQAHQSNEQAMLQAIIDKLPEDTLTNEDIEAQTAANEAALRVLSGEFQTYLEPIEENTRQRAASASGICEVPPACDPLNPMSCAILRQSWEAQCYVGSAVDGVGEAIEEGFNLLFGEVAYDDECLAAPVCASENAIGCAQVRLAWLARCDPQGGDEDGEAPDMNPGPDFLADDVWSDEAIDPEDFDSSGWGWGNSCPGLTLSVMTRTIDLGPSICPPLGVLGMIILMAGYVQAAYIVGRG